MVGESKPESVHKRFGHYIEELREFFTSRGVPFGQTEHLRAFAAQVAESGAFQDEMGSMVRSIVYREDDRLGRGELLELITVSVAGSSDMQIEQAAIRQIFIFVNAALRQRQAGFAGTEEDDTPPEATMAPPSLTAPVRPPLPRQAFSPNPTAREGQHASPGEPVQRRPVPGAGAQPVPRPSRSTPAETPPLEKGLPPRKEVLYRAMALSAEEPQPSAIGEEPSRETLRQRWIVPAIAGGLAIVGVGVYLAKPGTHRPESSKAGISAVPATAGVGPSCVAPMADGASISGLEERSHWARNLLDQGLYSSALPEIREIARLDPGFPGIKLDESDALLHLKRPDDAREAVDAQIATSECLAKLPAPALQAYCSVQFPSANLASCRPQLNHVRQTAELQAALVHLELGHQVEPDTSTAAAIDELNQAEVKPETPAAKPHHSAASAAAPKVERVEPLPPATEGDTAQPPLERVAPERPVSRRSKGDGSLVRGEGTDSVYGAYQKPQ